MSRLDLIHISLFQWSRWQVAATEMGLDGCHLVVEIHEARTDPTRKNIARCAEIAARVAFGATGRTKEIAATTALELEVAMG